MKTTPFRRNLWLFIGAALLIALGCTASNINIETVEVGELREESRRVDVGEAENVRVYIKMGAGDLTIEGEAEALMEADFSYNVEDWEPEILYEVNEESGRLTVRQPQSDKIALRDDLRYEWDLRFTDQVPLDVRIECGAGKSTIELGSLNITELDMKLGAGNAEVDLSGNTSLERMDFELGAGDVSLDLSGAWEHDVDVDIQNGFGKTEILLPKHIGVRVNVSKAIGDVDLDGLEDRGTYYANDAYDESGITLEINLQSGVGDVELRVDE